MYLYKKFRTALLVLPLIGASCSERPQDTAPSHLQRVRVTVGSGPRIDLQPQSRTALGDDGVTVRWSDDDRIALWAVNSSGGMAVNAAALDLWHYNASFGSAKFRGDIPPMEAGTHTYYAVSPVPDAVSGTMASYDIPALQDGTFDGGLDIMVAAPVEGPALSAGDNSDAVRFAFRHKVHVLKIRIAANKLGEPVERLEIAFPKPVTGRLTVDAADPDADPVLTQGSSLLTIDLREPIDQEAVVYATIAPVEIPQNEPVTITAIGRRGISKPGTFSGKAFLSGHTTPIALHVPETGLVFTQVRIALSGTGTETLGEAVHSFTLHCDEAAFDNGEHTRTFTVNAQGDYCMAFREFPEQLQGKTVRVDYESENARVSDSFTMPTLTAGIENVAATLTVPYLLKSDFSGLSADYDNSGKDGETGTKAGAKLLSEIGLEGWSACQVYLSAEHGVVRLRNRREYTSVSSFLGDSYGNYRGRLDSAPLSLKRPVAVRVRFSYGGATENSTFSPLLSCGWTTATDAIDACWEVYKYKKLSSSGGTKIENTISEYDGIDAGTDASWTSELRQGEYVIDACAPGTRLTWEVNATGKKKSTHANQWLYIDNIEVSILNR